MMMMTIYTVQIYPRCNSMFIVLEWPQPSSWFLLSLMVHAGYVSVAIIQQTLTQTTGSLSCAQMLMHVIAHGGVWAPKECLHWKLTLGRKSTAALRNWTCVSGVTVWCPTNWATCLPHWLTEWVTDWTSWISFRWQQQESPLPSAIKREASSGFHIMEISVS